MTQTIRRSDSISIGMGMTISYDKATKKNIITMEEGTKGNKELFKMFIKELT